MKMGDYSRHSPQIWRSFYIEMGCHDIILIPKICRFLQGSEIRFCFQRYGEWTRKKKTIEPEHISFRLIANDIGQIADFRRWLTKMKLKWTEGSWDEEWRVKKAYEIGTLIYLLYLEQMKELNSYGEITDPDNFKGFMLQMFHGFFNNLDFEYGDEEIIYSYALARLLNRSGFKAPALNHILNLNRKEKP